MEMLGKIHNEKRHEQVGEGHFKRQRQRERQPYRRGGRRRVVVAVGEGSGVVVDRGGRHGEAVIMRRIVDRASPSSV